MASLKLSIIIPVFNAAKYLTQCIQSVISQSLQDIEIIIINDGSTDESKGIIFSFAEKDSRIVFINSKKEGVSAARNKGIKIAKGEFIGFVDADDWIEPAMCEKFYQRAKEAGADLAICNVNVSAENKDLSVRLSLENSMLNIAGNREYELISLMRFKYDFANWNKIYSTLIVQQNNLYFDESMQVYEDLLFNCCYFQLSQKAVIIHETLYNYRVHPVSVMNQNQYDMVKEYNLLFTEFNSFCRIHSFEKILDSFNAEMRRGFYYAVLPKLKNQMMTNRYSFIKRISRIYTELNKANPCLFYFDRTELKGMQGIKKQLLKNKKYLLFSMVITIKG